MNYVYIYMLFWKKRHVFLNDNWCNSLPEIPALQRKEDSPNFLMDASAVVMELGLSMQKAVLFFFTKDLFLQEQISGIQGSID